MEIRINGIFNKSNCVIDLSKKCAIIIGENGVGKSTILSILNCILVSPGSRCSLFFNSVLIFIYLFLQLLLFYCKYSEHLDMSSWLHVKLPQRRKILASPILK